MSTATVVRREAACARKVMLRDPQAVFVTVGLPLLYLFIFATVFGRQTEHLRGQPGILKVSTVVVASVIVIGVISAAFMNLAAQLVHDREDGVLKRLRSTPVPTSAFLAGPVINAAAASLVLSVLVAALGRLAYGVSLPTGHVLAAVVTVIIGALAFCAMGCGFTVLIRKATAAMPVLFAVTLALLFLSGNFFATDSAPAAMRTVASIFPVRHFYTAMLTAFNPHVTGTGLAFGDLAVVALWGLLGGIAALRTFRWTPVRRG
jgi:ABC-2 type transport system permease protein